MKTKDFIKMLQEADPTGEGYLRIPGGIPFSAEAKAGYWDGSYDYIDQEGNWIRSASNYKVDIYLKDVSDYVTEWYDEHDTNCTFENLKERFKFELDCYVVEEQREQKKECLLNEVKESFDRIKNIRQKLFKESINKALDREKNGWRFFQNKKVDTDIQYTYYYWRIQEPNKPLNSSSISDTNGILYSGLFERLDNNQIEGYYEWILKKGVDISKS